MYQTKLLKIQGGFLPLIIRICGVLACINGLTWLALWFLGIAGKWATENIITVKTNMALGMSLAGASLLLCYQAPSAKRRTLSLIMAVLVLLIGALTLSEHLFHYDLKIDQVLATEMPGAAATSAPNRIGIPGSSSLLLIGICLLAFLTKRSRWVLYPALCVIMINIVPLVGYLYGFTELYSLPSITGIAFSAVIGMLTLSMALILMSEETGLTWLFTRRDPGGMLFRRLLPSVIFIPLLLGFVTNHLERSGLGDNVGLLVAFLIVALSAISWFAAAYVSKTSEALSASERLYRAISESLDFGIWICDAEGRNTYASDSLLKLLGITQAQCADFNWASALHPDDAEATIAAWKECVRTGNFWEREHRYRGVDGQWHPILARGVPVRDDSGKLVQWAGINLDISKLKKTEERLKAAVETRDEFLSIASHELKTPLTALLLRLQLLDRTAKQEPVDANRLISMSQVALKASKHWVRLIDELLDVTKIRAGKLTLEKQEMDLRATVIESVSALSEQTQKNGIDITVQADKPVLGTWDPLRINQIIYNLLSNAIKYGEGKAIKVTLTSSSACAQLAVEDHGIGIPLELQSKIFERFERGASGENLKISGLGLGLYIARQLVEAHGGSIRVVSTVGKGSTFTVELPLVVK